MARPTLSPYVLSSVERAQAYLKRPESVLSDEDEDVVVLALNAIVGLFEGEVGRRLACRVYRNSVIVSCTATVGDEALAAASGLSGLKTLDDAVGSALEIGSRVASITNDTSLELTKKATATGTMSVTFGSEPIVLDGYGKSVIYIPERPVVEVYGVKWVDWNGVKTALDLTNSRLDKETGRLQLASEVFPKGSQNIELEVKAGYWAASAIERGHWGSWSQLEMLCLRAVQVMFQDFDQAAGRTGEISLATATMKIQDFKLPEDIQSGLRRFIQPW